MTSQRPILDFGVYYGHMRKALSLFAVLALLSAGLPAHVRAASAGDLIKCPDFSSVYYLAEDGKRYVFPNEKIFYSWYNDFVDVKTVSCDDLALLPLGGRAVYQAGTRLVKLPSDPTVYVVEDDGLLRAIASEEQAEALFGDDWAKRVDDLSEAFWSSFTVGEEVADGEIPEGTIIKDDDGDLFRMEDGEAVEIDTVLDIDEEENLEEHAVALSDLEERIGVAIALMHVDADQAVEVLTEVLEKLKTIRVDDDDKVEFDEIEEETEEEIDQVIDAGDAIQDARDEVAKAKAELANKEAEGKDISGSEEYLADAAMHLEAAETAYGQGDYESAEEHADEAKHAAMWARGKAVESIDDDTDEEEIDEETEDEDDADESEDDSDEDESADEREDEDESEDDE